MVMINHRINKVVSGPSNKQTNEKLYFLHLTNITRLPVIQINVRNCARRPHNCSDPQHLEV